MRANKTPRRTSLMTHFWSLVDKNGPSISQELGPCWTWNGGSWVGDPGTSYGLFSIGTYKELAHRFSLEVANGPLGNLFALHRCDNPPCVNPAHLYAGTAADNGADRSKGGRPIQHRMDYWDRYKNLPLADFMRARNLGVKDAASVLGVSVPGLGNWLSGNSLPLKKKALAVAYRVGLNTKDLFGVSEDELQEYQGRRRRVTTLQILELRRGREAGKTIDALAEEFGHPRMTVYRFVRDIVPLVIHRKQRSKNSKSHCSNGHEFTTANTRIWRETRICRACERNRSEAFKSKKSGRAA